MHVKLPSIVPPDSLRMHLQPSIFKKILVGMPPDPPRRASCLRHSPVHLDLDETSHKHGALYKD